MLMWDTHPSEITASNFSYKNVKERRRLLHCPRTLRDLFSSTDPPYEPYEFFGKHKDRIKDFSADFGLMIEFLASFEPFRMLSVDDKVTKTSIALSQRIHPFPARDQQGFSESVLLLSGVLPHLY